MKALLCLAILLLSLAAAGEPLKAVVVTGGHGFAADPFLKMFQSLQGIACTHVVLKDDSEIFEDISQWPYDVIVLFNMTQKISEKRQQNFLALLDRGVGLVVLHHAIAAYSDWPEFRKIIGARYYLKDTVEDGVTHPQCQWQEGVDIPIHVADTNHPVTRGISDFTVNDETYKGYAVAPDNHVLLTTDNPKNNKEIAWVRQYRKANVCFIQAGHGESIFADPKYRQLVGQAIRWAKGLLVPLP